MNIFTANRCPRNLSLHHDENATQNFGKVRILLFFLAVLLFTSCGGKKNHYVLHYDFREPDVKLVLPDSLHEISDQAIIDDSTFACVEDEDGIIYIYDSKRNRIEQRIEFAGAGDYEGITKVNKDLYVLRSDGMLFEVTDFAGAVPRVETYLTEIPADDNEGICYDSLNNRLLIACKSRLDKETASKEKRAIYGFDLSAKKLSADPVFEFDIDELSDYLDNHYIDLADDAQLKFKSSAIAIQPGSGDLFVLSAVDHCLFVFDSEGNIRHAEPLKPKLFNKPEGIAFYPDGDVLISNEGQDKKPTLLRFDYQEEE